MDRKWKKNNLTKNIDEVHSAYARFLAWLIGFVLGFVFPILILWIVVDVITSKINPNSNQELWKNTKTYKSMVVVCWTNTAIIAITSTVVCCTIFGSIKLDSLWELIPVIILVAAILLAHINYCVAVIKLKEDEASLRAAWISLFLIAPIALIMSLISLNKRTRQS